MPRKSRKHSDTGIYHVMLRGIDRCNIFNEEQDCLKFIKILKESVAQIDKEGEPHPARCVIYAYCLMSNHVHLLIGDNGNDIGDVMKRIGVSYVSYYNKHHYRIGPLFQDRFRSEPVNNARYFITLLSYIHLNPVAAGITKHPTEYRWSSWHEYEAVEPLPDSICCKSFPFAELNWAKLRETVLKTVAVDMAKVSLERRRMTDKEAEMILARITRNAPLDHIKSMPTQQKESIIAKALSRGVAMRQLERLTGINFSAIRLIKEKFE